MKNEKLLLEKLHAIAKITDSVSFVYDLSSDIMQCVSYKEEKKIEYEIENYCINLLNGLNVHPNDRKPIEDLCNAISEGQPEIKATFRFDCFDDSLHWIDWYGNTIYDKNKIPEKIVGWISTSMNSEGLMMFMLSHLNGNFKGSNFTDSFLEKLADFFSIDAIQFVGYGINNQKKFQYFWNKSTCSFLNCMDVNLIVFNREFETSNLIKLEENEWLKLGLISSKIKSAFLVREWNATNNNYSFLLLLNCKNKRIWNEIEKKTLSQILSALLFTEDRDQAIIENIGLKKIITKDVVTGLSKLETFKHETQKIMIETPGIDYAIINSGFYNFQFINDNFGYSIGDAVLNRFGKFIKEELTIGKAFARGAGDQFVFLVECGDVQRVKERFITYCKRFCNDIENEIGINALIITSGLCYIKKGGSQKISKAIDNANLTRKVIKNKAETNCQIFRNEARANIAEQMRLTANMKKALENEDFVVYLQPKINLKTSETVGAEALVRWKLKDGSMIYPNQFIPLFEDNGFVSQIDFYVLQKVLIYLTRRKRKGLKLIPISVNFSRRHQDNPNFVSDIVALLDEYKIDKKWIEIEITESAFMNDIKKLHENLVLLRNNNICISIDDFGSGYSSLNVLSTVPADVIKIDRVFLARSDKKSRNMLKYLVLMIQGMGYRTITEGVETKEQVMFLKEIGCEIAQGYYYAKPMPKADFDIYCMQHGIKEEIG